MIRGLERQLEKDHKIEAFAVEGDEAAEEDGERDEMELEGIRQKLDQSLVPEAGEKEEDCAITPAEQAAVKKLHRGIGHPQKAEMIRFMRAAKVRGDIISWTAKHFECDVCKSKMLPKVNRPAAIPRSYQPNKVIGVDLIYIPEVGGNTTFPALSALDWGTNYQMVQRVPNKEPSEVWDVFNAMWMRTFGAPEVIVSDPGREFLASFIQAAASHGIVTYQTAAKAPWQQGRTERHGHHYKQMLEKARSEVVVTSPMELRRLMEEVEQAKNRYSNRSGFSPIQRQIGQWPRLPTNLLSDEALDPTLVAGALTDDIERLHHMRTIAHKAFVEVNSQEAIRKVLRGRPRVWQEFEAGEYVYVYRVPRPRKKKHGGSEVLEIASNKATWVGPGTVVLVDGANVWVSMLGELWKVAREQCRKATNDEKKGVEMVMRECKELVEQYKRNPHRAGYKDISLEEWPPTDEEDGGEEPPPRRGCRFSDAVEEVEIPGRESAEDEDILPTSDEEIGDREVGRSRRVSVEEPERENSGGIASSRRSSQEGEVLEELAEGEPRPGSVVGPGPLIEDLGEEQYREAVSRSRERADRLDDHGPVRSRDRGGAGHQSHPYQSEFTVLFQSVEEAAEDEEEEQKRKVKELIQEAVHGAKKDYWEVDWRSGTLKRVHQKKRRQKFKPDRLEGLPWKVEDLEATRRTVKQRLGGAEFFQVGETSTKGGEKQLVERIHRVLHQRRGMD